MSATTPDNTADPEPLADPMQVAFRRLGIGRSAGFNLIRNGELPAYNVGRRKYVTREAQRQFIAKRITHGRAA